MCVGVVLLLLSFYVCGCGVSFVMFVGVGVAESLYLIVHQASHIFIGLPAKFSLCTKFSFRTKFSLRLAIMNNL